MAKIRIVGDASGYVELSAQNAAGNNTLELPSGSTKLVGSDNSGNIVVGVVTATSIAGVSTAGITTAYIGSINDGPISGARNRIINGDMRIDQRNNGASLSLSGAPYTVDRFIARPSSVCTGQRSSVAPVGFTSSFLYSVTTGSASGSGGTAYFTQYIEGYNMADLNWGTSNAKPVTLSFWVRSSIAGTYGISFSNPGNTLGYTASYSVSSINTWEYKTVTFPGSTTGTWAIDNTAFCYIVWDLGVGSSYSTSGGSWYSGVSIGLTGGIKLAETTGATWYITGVQLEPGTVATPFERRSYGQELALCQRYYFKTVSTTNDNNALGSGFCFSTTGALCSIGFPITMRTQPTALEQSGTASHYALRFGSASSTCSSVPLFNDATTTSAVTTFTVSSGLTQGQGCLGRFATTSGFLAWSAEL